MLLLLFNEAVLAGGRLVVKVSEHVASVVLMDIVPKFWLDPTLSSLHWRLML